MRFLFFFFLFFLSACTSQKVCFDCSTKKQEWKSSPFPQMTGRWRGGIEIVSDNIKAKKKEKREDPVNLVIVNGAEFKAAHKVDSCDKLPADSIVMMGQLWTKNADKSFDAFAANGNGNVVYGKVQIKNVNGQKFCDFTKIGGEMVQNGQWLPTVSFTERRTNDGRVLASGSTPEDERIIEVLRFSPASKQKEFKVEARRPAALNEQDKPALVMRVSRTSRNVDGPFANGRWQETQEFIYRLWRAN
jgi:hypothetical protein